MTLKDLLPSLVVLGGILLVTWVLLGLSTRAIRRLARQMGEEDREHIEEIERWANQLVGFVRRTIEIVAGVVALLMVLRSLGVRGFRQLKWEEMADWLTGPGLRILFILGGAYVLTRLLHLGIARLPLLLAPPEGPLAETLERQKRATTISRLLRWLTTASVMGIAVLIVLREVGVDITPILTGAGIAGLAVGFGAQHLVRDIISGLFLITEDQVRIGDVARIDGKAGLVEAIRLRTIVLRDFDGAVHIIPNGAITELSNLTKDYSYYVIDLGLAYKENVDQVMGTLREVGRELAADSTYAPLILAPLEVVGVDAFADSAVVLKMRIKTVPRQQWTVGRELRRRIKNALDARGIEIPYPHLSLYFGEASKPFAVAMTEPAHQPEAPGPKAGSEPRK